MTGQSVAYIFFDNRIAAQPRESQTDLCGQHHQAQNYVVVCDAGTEGGKAYPATTIAESRDEFPFPGYVGQVRADKLVYLEYTTGRASDVAISARMDELNLSNEERANVVRAKMQWRQKTSLDEKFDL